MQIERIVLEGLKNTRDLGGFEADLGRKIKYGRLIRSGELFNASEADKRLLSEKYHLSEIIDFRTEAERHQKPDPEISGAVYTVNPILKEETLGITREDEGAPDGIKQMLALVFSGDFDSKAYMRDIYKSIIRDSYSRTQYKRFFEILLRPHDGAVLWHCSAGKDRVGVATALLLSALGVSRENIIEDYMKVNDFTAEETEKVICHLLKDDGSETHKEHLRTMFRVDAAYIESVFDIIEKEWGGMEAFLTGEMGLDKEKLRKLKMLYLENADER